MFIRKATVEKLLERIDKQEKEIDKLHEKVAILAQSLNQQFEFVIGEGYKLSPIRPGHGQFIDAKRKAAHSSDS